jgi:protein tyrosine phosphatase (PTP) superfamily phosphohydrolase (DUF442 family)
VRTLVPTKIRQPSWAAPVTLPGVTNCFKVHNNLYRGAQPTAEGIQQLKNTGIKTIINLRTFHSDKDEASGIEGIKRIHLYVQPWHIENKEIETFLKTMQDPESTPAFIHCQHGSDRTGTFIAVYRMVLQGWTPQEALEELKYGGYGFHAIWTNLEKFVLSFDVSYWRSRFAPAEGNLSKK